MSKVKFNSEVDKFLRNQTKKRDDAIKEIGQKGEDNIRKETPVDTGNLQQQNSHAVSGTFVIWYNKASYSPYVELGTYKQRANPFMRRGINKTKSDIVDILKRELSV